MTRLRVLVSRVLDLLFAAGRERRLDEEIRNHLDLLTDQYVAAGLAPDDARAAARRAFGGVDRIKDAYRDQSGLPLVEALGQDVRFAIRMMRRHRGFALTAVLVLGLGIGVNNMLFTILNAHTLRGMPIRQSDRVLFMSSLDDRGVDGGLSFADYTDIRGRALRYREIAAFRASPMVLAGDGQAAERLDGAFVTANTFDAIGVQPVLGRGFAAADDLPGAAAVAMISRTVWATRYGSDIAVLGRTVMVDDRPVTLIGILPDRSGFPGTAAIWLPLWQSPGLAAAPRDERTLQVFGRVADNTRVEEAMAEVSGLAERIAAEHPDTNRQTRVQVVGINDRFLGSPTDTVWLAFMTAGFIVVLISSANVANLMLDRSLLRARELAIRASIGGSRLRLVRQLLVEGAVIAAAGAGVGLLVAIGGIRAFRSAIPSDALPYWLDYSLDWRVLAALIGVSALTVFCFALLPAILASKTDIVAVLKDGGRPRSSGRRLWPSAFLAAQIALAVVLLAHFAVNLRVVAPGLASDRIFGRTDIVTAALSLPTERYPSTTERAALYDALVERLRASASITAVAIASTIPSSRGDTRVLTIEGEGAADGNVNRTVLAISITPDYFRVLDVALLQGRELDDSDGGPGQENVVVNEVLARQHFPAGGAIGRRIALAAPEESKGAIPRWVTIVGIAPAIRQGPGPVPGTVYEALPVGAPASAWVIVRGRGAADTATVVARLRQAVQGLDASLPIYGARTLARVRDDAMWVGRVSNRLFTFLTSIAVVLSAIGLYAVTAHGVSQQRQEIGIRVALGARPRQIVGRVLGGLMMRTLVGFAAGVLCTVVWDWTFPTGAAAVRATDPMSLAIVGAALLGIVVVAAIVPGRRASRVDPLVALRVE